VGRRRVSKREELAYHEAGHAVMAFVMGVDIDHVSIQADDTTAGHMETDKDYWVADFADDPRMATLRMHFCSLAGPIAMNLHLNGECRTALGTSDITDILDTTLMLTTDDKVAADHLCDLYDKVREILERPDVWAGVQAVAKGLLARGTLSRDQVIEAVTKAGCIIKHLPRGN
jgi:hypothetical protein